MFQRLTLASRGLRAASIRPVSWNASRHAAPVLLTAATTATRSLTSTVPNRSFSLLSGMPLILRTRLAPTALLRSVGTALRSVVPRIAANANADADASASGSVGTITAIPMPIAVSFTTQLLSSAQRRYTASAIEAVSAVANLRRRVAQRWLSAASTLLSDSKLPKGFKSFFPKRAQAEADDAASAEKDKKQPKKDGETDAEADAEKPKSDKGKESESDEGEKKAGGKDGDKPKSKKDGDGGDKKPDRMRAILYALIAASLGTLMLSAFLPGGSTGTAQRGDEISFQEFVRELLGKNKVEKLVVVNNTIALVVLKDQQPGTAAYHFTIGSIESFERKLQYAQEQMDLDPRDFVPVQYTTRVNYAMEVLKLLPTLLFIGFGIYMIRNMMGDIGSMTGTKRGGKNIFSFGKSPATMTKPGEKTKIMFKDVAGLDEAKVEIMEFVKFLKNPAKFTKLGAKIPRGALLVGPPGTGKTLLAKATAGEASVPFFSISGSDFIEMFVGVGPSRVRDLFADARKNAPCIVFIDEIDAVGRSRSKGGFSGGNDERENTLNQLLVEMDGFNTDSGVVVMAGTNRVDILDKALLRPGRFDRQISIDKPDIKGRKQIFLVHLKPLKLGHPIDDLAGRLAALTPGFAGADIANVCNEAALIAARGDKKSVELVDFESACDRIIGGLEKKSSIMTPEERKLVAYHEAGHAVVGWMLEHAHPVLKVTIVPRGKGALGFAQYLPTELSLYQQAQLLDMMCMTLGGRASEQVFFGKVSSGAADDLKKVTKLAYAQVANFGMSAKLGNVSFAPDENDSQFTKPFSEHTAQIIDSEVSALVRDSYTRTLQIVEEHKIKIEALALRLLKEETINHDVIVEVLGKRKYASQVYADYVANAESDRVVAAKKSADKAKLEADESAAAAAAAAAATGTEPKPTTTPPTNAAPA